MSLYKSLASSVSSLIHLLYPQLCYYCWQEPPAKNNKLCIDCLVKMPYTVDFDHINNNVSKHFFGRVPFIHAAALLNYFEDSPLTGMLHRFKYKNKKEVGIFLGELLGKKIDACPLYGDMDAVTYVPLHPIKQEKRGYNQSRLIAEGVANILRLEVLDHAIKKIVNNPSQTRKSRSERLKNVANAFAAGSDEVAGKHVLLVDDVITTGATIEACCKVLTQLNAKNISIASAAVARS